jgi:cytochrome d ubiquinol oxidase subunit II
MSALQIIWFLLIGILFTIYALLDGFDLGVGFWSLFTKEESHKRQMYSSIGPVWDANEVWLLTAGGALFAAFPPVYASVFSGFYLALMLVLAGLIFRAVALEFRSEVDSPAWKKKWDLAFGLGSSLSALLFGVALGNILRGLPLDSAGNFTGDFFTLLNPFSLLIGLLGFAMLTTHGALYIALKVDNQLASTALTWAKKSWWAYGCLLICTIVVSLLTETHLMENYFKTPILWLLPLLATGSVLAIGLFVRQQKAGRAFVSSGISIVALLGMTGASLFPNLVRSLDPGVDSLTLMNSSSSELSLTAMLVLTLMGLPLVLGYSVWVYKTFAGKVDTSGYGD